MTDDTPPVRDASGRFVKRATETVNALSRTSDEGIHPMAKVLFGWTEAKGIGTILLCLTCVLSVLLILADLLVDRHETINAAGLFGFYGLFGFAALGFVLLAGWPLKGKQRAVASGRLGFGGWAQGARRKAQERSRE